MMDLSLLDITFYATAAVIIVCSILAVTTGRIVRSATYLLFVLFGTGVIYSMLGYTYLGAVQLMVYAGGIVVLYIFSILLTRSSQTMRYRIGRGRLAAVLAATATGTVLVIFLLASQHFALVAIPQGVELPAREIGHAMIGSDKYQYVLPFEVVSVLLVACMIGAILIARRHK